MGLVAQPGWALASQCPPRPSLLPITEQQHIAEARTSPTLTLPLQQVDKDLREEGMPLKADAPRPKTVGVRVWPRAIPQFNVGHLDQLEKAKSGLKEAGWDGIHLGGNYVCGVALGKCVEFSWEYASNIAGYLEKAAAK